MILNHVSRRLLLQRVTVNQEVLIINTENVECGNTDDSTLERETTFTHLFAYVSCAMFLLSLY